MKKIAFIISITLNVLFLTIIIFSFSRNTSLLSFLSVDSDMRFTTAAAVVSFPQGADAAFGPIELSLKTGQRAAVQFSAVMEKRQTNWVINALYDHSIIAHEITGYGIIITALKAGETVMQSVTNNGIVDIAYIEVTD